MISPTVWVLLAVVGYMGGMLAVAVRFDRQFRARTEAPDGWVVVAMLTWPISWPVLRYIR